MSRSRWPRVLRMVLGSVALAGATGSVRPAPERASVPPATRVEDTRSVACGACHPAEHAAWSRSAHHLAGTDPLFTRELETAMDDEGRGPTVDERNALQTAWKASLARIEEYVSGDARERVELNEEELAELEQLLDRRADYGELLALEE